ncbi:hypothetical protein GCM10023205_59590 [Yinghuangia aomiensis]|uniref:Uncharacterized protein n=1 Tax=Yinghuangia aomiensis TaxID=676205 RepID=A0ABP9HZ59_9ACTN
MAVAGAVGAGDRLSLDTIHPSGRFPRPDGCASRTRHAWRDSIKRMNIPRHTRTGRTISAEPQEQPRTVTSRQRILGRLPRLDRAPVRDPPLSPGRGESCVPHVVQPCS